MLSTNNEMHVAAIIRAKDVFITDLYFVEALNIAFDMKACTSYTLNQTKPNDRFIQFWEPIFRESKTGS